MPCSTAFEPEVMKGGCVETNGYHSVAAAREAEAVCDQDGIQPGGGGVNVGQDQSIPRRAGDIRTLEQPLVT